MVRVHYTGKGDSQPDSTDNYHYIHRDQQGSILAISDAQGGIEEKTHYSPWGKVTNYINADGDTDFGYNSLLGRGYTGHEHFVSVGIIHMNGRIYDPQLKRFLSPDNFVSDPHNTQCYNRYAYCWGNPLKHIDINGEEPITLTAILIGAAVGAWMGGTVANGTASPLKWDYQDSI